MLGKRSRPTTIAKLAGALRSAGIMDSSTSPRSPLDCRILSPRGSKNYDQLGGVGLAIAVALDNNNNTSGCGSGGAAVCGQFSSRSKPIPVNYSTASNQYRKVGEDQEMMLEEEFTYVTCHGPNKSITTKVYYDGCENNVHVQATMSSRRINQNLGVFKISSPATTTLLFDDRCCSSDSDFLSSCYLCRKTLHGKDIYMYRGEKAFCSTECRQRQIGIDERKEQCRSEASRSSNVSSSYTTSRGQIFSTGIVAV